MKKTIAVIFGGRSVEHDVSIITAHIPIIKSLLASGQFKVRPIYIAKNGCWYSEPAMNDLKYFQQDNLERRLKRLKKIRLLFDGGLKFVRPSLFKEKTEKIDIVFPALHGTFGEDGSLMGLLRMFGVPFVGCDLFASAVAMDKVLTKQIAAAESIAVVPYVWFTREEWKKNGEKQVAKIEQLKWPLFAKPVHLGSSIAVARTQNISELKNALEVAFHYDDKVLVEEAVKNLIEVTLPIMGNEELYLGAIERPLPKADFFNFQDKYLSGGKKNGGRDGVNVQYSELPAKISEQLAKEVKVIGKKVYRILGCSGMARIDFLIDGSSSKVYLNEVNTLPGSLYHHNWRSVGLSGVELVTRLVALAEKRFQQQRQSVYAFKSDILKKI